MNKVKRILPVALIVMLVVGFVSTNIASAQDIGGADSAIVAIGDAVQKAGATGIVAYIAWLFWGRIKEQQQVIQDMLKGEQARNDRLLDSILLVLEEPAGDTAKLLASLPALSLSKSPSG